MKYPYTSEPIDALIVAETSVAIVLAATLWFRPIRPRTAMLLLFSAIALAVLAPVGTVPFAGGGFLRDLGLAVGPHFAKPALKVAAALATLSALVSRRRPLVIVALGGEALLWPITDFIQKCDAELAATHLALFGVIIGTSLRTPEDAPPRPQAPPSLLAWRDDLVAFLVASLAGAIVARVVLHGWTASPDEWANTFQASLFAKLRAYGSVPRCAESFRSYWVYQYMGRSFAQYTPGWPLFIAPFVLFGAPWLSGPAALGLLAAGVMRLGRRAAAAFPDASGAPSPAVVLASGRFAALALTLSPMMVLNGGSRFSEVFVAATFAWSVEALCAVATDGLSPRGQWRWGAVLGASAAFMLSARPLDGGTLGLGLLLYFAYASKRGLVGWRAAAAASALAGVIGAVTLVILRLQLGRWFTTGYSLTSVVYPWAVFGFSVPHADEFKWGFPIAAGAYCWWPCSPAVALAGIAPLRGMERRLGFIFLVSCGALLLAYTLSEFGRTLDAGYGPRHALACIVPMSVGTGVVLGRLWGAGAGRASASGGDRTLAVGPICLALAGVFFGVLRIAPMIYPDAYADAQRHNWLRAALSRLDLHDAVVLGGAGDITDPLDLPQNLPLDLYPPPDVLIGIDRGPEAARCVREAYPDRSIYRAVFGHPAQIVPY